MSRLQVFISWSGEPSRAMARCLLKWLPTIVPGVELFSSDEIPGGAIWARSLLEHLVTSHYGLLCVTRENRHSVWLNFEAGSLWKRFLDGLPVCPLLLDLEPSDLPGPLALFQARSFNQSGMEAVCRQMAQLTHLPEARLAVNFEVAWPQLKVCVESGLPAITISAPRQGSQVPRRPKIEGWVQDPKVPVWVIVHPIAASGYWVQPPASVGTKGNWQAGVYIGQSGTEDIGQLFEICAVACSDDELSEGMVLSHWPSAKWRSQIIEVVRA